MQNNGWNLFQFQPFAMRLRELTQDVSSLALADPLFIGNTLKRRYWRPYNGR